MAEASLLKGALYCFTAPATTSETTISTFSRMAADLEAESFFIDATEHDGFIAAAENLPQLLSVALVQDIINSPAWRDAQKYANYRFASGIEACASSDVAEDILSLLENRENVVIHINTLLRELLALRDVISKGDEESITRSMIEAAELRSAWLSRLNTGLWDESRYPNLEKVPKSGQHMLGRILFGEGLMQRLDRDPDRRREH
jgi:prephenate dehydrogenase